MKKGASVTCPNCGEAFQISKSSEQGDIERCPACDAKLQVLKKNRKFDVRLLERQGEGLDIEQSDDYEDDFESYD